MNIPIKIKYPIWKTRSVGIAEHTLGRDGIDIEILYEDKQGNRIYPHVYHISRANIIKYPVQILRGFIKLRIVPIDRLEVKDFRYAGLKSSSVAR